jgi:hypothetical protein
MTEHEVQALRTKWNQRVDLLPCEHESLELEVDDLDHSTGNIVCFTCGESVAQGPLAKVRSEPHAQHPHKSDVLQQLRTEDSVPSACRVPDVPHINDRRSDAMLPIEEAIIDKLRSGPCSFDDVVTALPNFSWGELFVAVDCMSRDRRVSLLQIGYSTFQISLGSRSRIQAPLHDGAEVDDLVSCAQSDNDTAHHQPGHDRPT